MTINLPNDLESRLQATVQSGRFASVDDAIAEAARLLFRELDRSRKVAILPDNGSDSAPDPLFGLWQDYADEMDAIVADAYRHRREESWRELDL